MPYTHDANARNAAHRRVRRDRGRASEHMCVVGGDHPAEHWAHIHDTDFNIVDNYRSMCANHHREYDRPTRAHLTGVKYSEERRKNIAEGRKRAWARLSAEERKAMMPRDENGRFVK